MSHEICMVDGCDSLAVRRGCCNKHYRRWIKHGTFERQNKRSDSLEMEKFVEKAKAHDSDECLIWPYGKDKDGYGWFRGEAVHRMMCKHENGPPPSSDRNECAHSCETPSCVNKRHLRWATKSENMQDKYRSDK